MRQSGQAQGAEAQPFPTSAAAEYLPSGPEARSAGPSEHCGRSPFSQRNAPGNMHRITKGFSLQNRGETAFTASKHPQWSKKVTLEPNQKIAPRGSKYPKDESFSTNDPLRTEKSIHALGGSNYLEHAFRGSKYPEK